MAACGTRTAIMCTKKTRDGAGPFYSDATLLLNFTVHSQASSKDSKHPSHVSLMRRASPQSPFRIVVQHLVFPSLVFSDGLAATLCSANCDATCPVPVCRTCGWRSYGDVVFVPGASHSFRVKDWILLPSAVHSMQLILSAYTV
jgi:hypothetical protein